MNVRIINDSWRLRRRSFKLSSRWVELTAINPPRLPQAKRKAGFMPALGEGNQGGFSIEIRGQMDRRVVGRRIARLMHQLPGE